MGAGRTLGGSGEIMTIASVCRQSIVLAIDELSRDTIRTGYRGHPVLCH
jgi:hypothetical protein